MMYKLFARVNENDFSIPKTQLDNSSFATILQIVFGIAGGVALIIFMLAGLKYITSRGDPSAVAKAKNTILYAIIGLIVTAFAFTIVTFVVKSV
jgi:hypothetical protein